MRTGLRRSSLLVLSLVSCVRLIPEARPPGAIAPVITTALAAGVRAGPDFASLGLTPGMAAPALASFRESCPRLLGRTDGSGLTRVFDWKPACDNAAGWPAGDAQGFFSTHFESAVVGEGAAYVTGYYEPEIAGVRTRQPGFDVPVYGMPSDLVRAQTGDAPANKDGRQPLGRYDETGRFEPYYDRAAIEDGALAGKGLEIAWVADPLEFFFLQVQGSGRLRAPDGSIMRIGYAGQNGQAYTGIGGLMRTRGLIGTGPGQYSGSMQGIMQYIREHPDEGRALMRREQELGVLPRSDRRRTARRARCSGPSARQHRGGPEIRSARRACVALA